MTMALRCTIINVELIRQDCLHPSKRNGAIQTKTNVFHFLSRALAGERERDRERERGERDQIVVILQTSTLVPII